MAVKRQFIAGAACPSCGAVDRVQRCLDGERIWMECVACGMVRDLDEQPAAVDANEQPVALRGPKPR
ncbi:YheV family putative metal-binding protein [Alloalcanivorax sp. C16-1]|uniref:YheV family putative metal-binding protein n=1 Tax=Alloalcanivorax sp. C16-1 TaxID=3390051 RepID=UPI003970C257